MSSREELVERKRRVIAEAAVLRRQAEQLRRAGDRRRRLRRLEERIEALANEEYRLRQEIDRAPPRR
jgi:hypothetical protein